MTIEREPAKPEYSIAISNPGIEWHRLLVGPCKIDSATD
jgi:hypothetical protein